MRKLEVIVLNVKDSIDAQAAGADRLELVREIEVGGLSPDLQTVRDVIAAVDIPVNVMIRFKSSDFVYTSADIDELLEYIGRIKDIGINGIVFGSLDLNNNVNVEQLKQVISKCTNLDITYHRAIDEDFDKYYDNISAVSGLVTNVLTSAGTVDVIENNIDILNEVSKRSSRILVGGGITENNYLKLIDNLHNCDFHIGSLAYNEKNFSKGINEKQIRLVKAAINAETKL